MVTKKRSGRQETRPAVALANRDQCEPMPQAGGSSAAGGARTREGRKTKKGGDGKFSRSSSVYAKKNF